MCRYYGVLEKYAEVCEWYDGYRFGNSEIFNPWSVINYFNRKCEPQAFWLSTSSNDIIGEVLEAATPEIRAKLAELMLDGTVLTTVDIGVIYPQMKKESGFGLQLSADDRISENRKKEQQYNGAYIYRVALPNKEIKLAYNTEILAVMEEIVSYGVVSAIQEALYMGEWQSASRRTIAAFDADCELLRYGIRELFITVCSWDCAQCLQDTILSVPTGNPGLAVMISS